MPKIAITMTYEVETEEQYIRAMAEVAPLTAHPCCLGCGERGHSALMGRGPLLHAAGMLMSETVEVLLTFDVNTAGEKEDVLNRVSDTQPTTMDVQVVFERHTPPIS